MDVILLQGFTLRAHPWLATTGARLVMDMYDPVHLEILEGAQGSSTVARNDELAGGLEALRVQFEHGDFFLCASERQRDLWLGYMSALGRVNFATYEQDSTLRKLIDLAPFGIDAAPPLADGEIGAIKGVIDGIGPDDTVLLWAGGVYNWFDPLTLIDAVGDLAVELPTLRLLFMGTKHPSLDDLSTTVLRQAIELAERRGLLGKHVFFREGWVPYQERGRYLADADIGVSTHVLHVETAFSFRTRMLDYLWAGLPIVCTEGDEFAGIVEREGLGRVVAPGDRAGWAGALRELLADPAELAACRAASVRTAERFRWPRALAPLVAYCADPWRAPDSGRTGRPVGTGDPTRRPARCPDGQDARGGPGQGCRRFDRGMDHPHRRVPGPAGAGPALEATAPEGPGPAAPPSRIDDPNARRIPPSGPDRPPAADRRPSLRPRGVPGRVPDAA